MEIDPDKLEKLFSERYEKLEGLAPVVGAKRPLSNPGILPKDPWRAKRLEAWLANMGAKFHPRDARYASLKPLDTQNPAYEHWIDYCDEHGVVILHPEWLRETINEGIGDKICIHSPEDSGGPVWLLVPREFAEKCIAMGGLP